MIQGNITVSCDKCNKAYHKDFTSSENKYNEIPSRDSVINEFNLKTLWVGKEYLLCPECGIAWDTEQKRLTSEFENESKIFLAKK